MNTPPDPCNPRCRLDHSIFAILCLYDVAHITESQAQKLMNCASLVEFRLLREKMHRDFRKTIAPDMKLHGWEFTP